MRDENITRAAEAYLCEMDDFLHEMHNVYSKLRKHYEHFREHPNVDTRIDLQSSIAFFEKHVRPVIVERKARERVFTYDSDLLEFRLSDRWRAYEFRQLFESVDYLNKIFVLKGKLAVKAPDVRIARRMTRCDVYRLAKVYYYLAPHEELRIRRVRLASPGMISFEGIAETIREVRELIEYIITFQFVRKFCDMYDYFAYERQIKKEEYKRKLRALIQQEQSEERKIAIEEAEDYQKFLKIVKGVVDEIEELDRRGLVEGDIAERRFIQSMLKLHRMGFDERKITLSSGEDKLSEGHDKFE